jgi:hypothetical protein
MHYTKEGRNTELWDIEPTSVSLVDILRRWYGHAGSVGCHTRRTSRRIGGLQDYFIRRHESWQFHLHLNSESLKDRL